MCLFRSTGSWITSSNQPHYEDNKSHHSGDARSKHYEGSSIKRIGPVAVRKVRHQCHTVVLRNPASLDAYYPCLLVHLVAKLVRNIARSELTCVILKLVPREILRQTYLHLNLAYRLPPLRQKRIEVECILAVVILSELIYDVPDIIHMLSRLEIISRGYGDVLRSVLHRGRITKTSYI